MGLIDGWAPGVFLQLFREVYLNPVDRAKKPTRAELVRKGVPITNTESYSHAVRVGMGPGMEVPGWIAYRAPAEPAYVERSIPQSRETLLLIEMAKRQSSIRTFGADSGISTGIRTHY